MGGGGEEVYGTLKKTTWGDANPDIGLLLKKLHDRSQ